MTGVRSQAASGVRPTRLRHLGLNPLSAVLQKMRVEGIPEAWAHEDMLSVIIKYRKTGQKQASAELARRWVVCMQTLAGDDFGTPLERILERCIHAALSDGGGDVTRAASSPTLLIPPRR